MADSTPSLQRRKTLAQLPNPRSSLLAGISSSSFPATADTATVPMEPNLSTVKSTCLTSQMLLASRAPNMTLKTLQSPLRLRAVFSSLKSRLRHTALSST